MRHPDAPPMPGRMRLTVRPLGRKDPIALFRRVQRGRRPFFLDSSLPDPELARYSFLGSDPVGWFRARTPSTFGGFLEAGDHRLLSASPERFLRVRGREVETRPIKGTRPRGRTHAADERLAQELLASEKDAAENVMIVDLERNDLGKVCEFGSVHVPVLRGLRSLPNVHHLESVVRGRLRDDVTVPRLLRATFPGGSITGAPKPRAMEIIERLEPHRRGVYTGALGYVSWDRSLDWNIAIRTATVIGPTAYFAVGGGIVADSDPEAEYQETLDKLRGHAEALTQDRVEVTPDGLRVA